MERNPGHRQNLLRTHEVSQSAHADLIISSASFPEEVSQTHFILVSWLEETSPSFTLLLRLVRKKNKKKNNNQATLGRCPPTLQSRRSNPSSQQHLRLDLHGGGLSPVPLLVRLCVSVCVCESEPPISTRPISSALQGNTST